MFLLSKCIYLTLKDGFKKCEEYCMNTVLVLSVLQQKGENELGVMVEAFPNSRDAPVLLSLYPKQSIL